MAISFTDEFKIDQNKFKATKALDIILNVDTPYFIDPALLSICDIKEFKDSEAKVKQFFSDIKLLLLSSKSQGDMFWKEADKRLSFNEYTQTCLGYATQGTNGKAIGEKLRYRLLNILKTLLETGKDDTRIFELIGLFQEDFGVDRISDLITYILLPNIATYTERITTELNIPNNLTVMCTLQNKSYRLPFNRHSGSAILLLPKAIVAPIPLAEYFLNIEKICEENNRVRVDINKIIDLSNKTKFSKADILQLLQNSSAFKNAVLEQYANTSPMEYDYDTDTVGLLSWYEEAKKITTKYPLNLTEINYDKNGIQNIIEAILQHFKTLVENNGLCDLFYNDNDGSKKRERAIHLLFFGIADQYCKINNIDCTREANEGRGPVDFKFSRGYNCKILIEVKWSSSKELYHGFEVQLPTYMKQENCTLAYYLVVDAGTNEKRLNEFASKYANSPVDPNKQIIYFYVDGRKKESASKA